jgi:tRNA pseudouridine55 synthase
VNPVSGFVGISKPAGLTSFQSLGPIKRGLASDRVGHAGTLDRFATGLLVVLVGSYSRLTPYFSSLDKTYRAVVRFGAETDTLDPEGVVVREAPLPSREAVLSVLPSFRGPILQAPPLYSAVHVDGERAYTRALRGEALEMRERSVTIHDLELLSWQGREAVFLVRCSSGTYIRSLARDMARAAGSCASLGSLARESIGPFRLSDAVAPDAFDPGKHVLGLDPSTAAALGLRPRMLAPAAESRFANGGRLLPSELGDMETAGGDAPTAPSGPAFAAASAVFSKGGRFLGVVEETPDGIRYRFVNGGTQ